MYFTVFNINRDYILVKKVDENIVWFVFELYIIRPSLSNKLIIKKDSKYKYIILNTVEEQK